MYRCFNPSTLKVRVSWDVVFDEMASWDAPELTTLGTSTNDLDNTEDDDQLRSIPDDSLISTRLSRPQEPPSDQSTSRPSPKMDKGKANMPKYEDDPSDDNESTQSLDIKLGAFDVPLMRSPGVQKALTSANEKLRRSTREKNPISRSGYNDYMAYHYAFMMKVTSDREPESFAKPAKNPR